MKPLILILFIGLAGCAHKPVVTPETVSVRASGAAAKRKVQSAGERIIIIKEKAPAELRPELEAVAQDLREATAQLDFQTGAMKELDARIAVQTAQLTGAITARDAAVAERDAVTSSRWRWRIATLVLLGWTFRKQLLAGGKIAISAIRRVISPI